MSEASYESLLAMPGVTSFTGGLQVSSGAVSFQLASESWKSGPLQRELLIKVHLPKLPNIEVMGDKAAAVTIEHVWTKRDQEILDSKSPFESEVYRKIKFSPIVLPSPLLEGQRKVQLVSSVTESDIKGVEGRLSLYLPIEIETIQLDMNNINRPVAKAGVHVWVEKAGNGEVVIQYIGELNRLITTNGYNSSGKDVTCSQTTVLPSRSGVHITYSFFGDVSELNLLVANRIGEKNYSFLLGDRGPVSQMTPAKKLTPSIINKHSKKKSQSGKKKKKVKKIN
jgi:hypothetical protein